MCGVRIWRDIVSDADNLAGVEEVAIPFKSLRINKSVNVLIAKQVWT